MQIRKSLTCWLPTQRLFASQFATSNSQLCSYSKNTQNYATDLDNCFYSNSPPLHAYNLMKNFCFVVIGYCLKSFLWVYRTPATLFYSIFIGRDYVICLHIWAEKLSNENKVFEWKWYFEWDYWNWSNKAKLTENLWNTETNLGLFIWILKLHTLTDCKKVFFEELGSTMISVVLLCKNYILALNISIWNMLHIFQKRESIILIAFQSSTSRTQVLFTGFYWEVAVMCLS